MTEKEFEQLLIANPDLIEEGLIFKGNQVNLEGKQLDLLFEDRNGQKLIIELKLIAKRKDIAQLLDYTGYFIEKMHIPVRAMVVALRIPANYRYSFDYFGIEYKEISEADLPKELYNISDEDTPNPSFYAHNEGATSIPIENKRKLSLQNEKNLTRQNMASRMKSGSLFSQARHAIEFLNRKASPVSMQEITAYMKSMKYKSKSYYDLFNALCDSGLVKSTVKDGRKVYLLSDD